MGATTAFAIGLGIGQGLSPADEWSPAGALLDADFAHRRYRHAGHSHSAEASFLAAVGGVRSGSAITVGPTVTGPELLANGSFDSNVSGWVVAGSGADAPPTWVSPGQLQVSVPAGGPTGNRFAHSVTVTPGKAYRFGGTALQNQGSPGGVQWWTGLGGGTVSNTPGGMTASQPKTSYGGGELATQYIGVATSGVIPRVEQWDDFTVKEVVPLVGHNYLALAGRIAASTPATASGNKVLFQADDASAINSVAGERNRVRVVWDADKHLRLIITQRNIEQANLDLGIVETATPFAMCFSATANNFKANLDGNAVVGDTAGGMPAIAAYRIGRSNTGEAWDGDIGRVTLFPTALDDAEMVDPQRALAIYGDSTAHGDNGTAGSRWWELLAAGYAPDRTVYNAGVGGQISTAMRDGLLADSTHRDWTTIIMDAPNSGESAATALAAYKAAIGNLRTDRWLIVPPVDNSPEAATATNVGVAGVQQALLSDPFFTGHTFDVATQAAYLADLIDDAMRTDGVHFNDAGQALQATYIRDWLDTRGW